MDNTQEDVLKMPEANVEPVRPNGHRVRGRLGNTRVQVEHLDAFYGTKQVLFDVSLAIPANSITALIGPSGCGKSTFLRCINRMNELIKRFRMTGLVSLDGQDITAREVNLPRLRRTVGMVFQQPNPFPMSIFENVAFGVRENDPGVRRSELREIVEHSLIQANLMDEVRDSLSDSAFSLSGGQQQRLCIARALAVKPEVIMLDEPCSALDPLSTARIEELLAELADIYTIVIVTHNLAQARRISDRMAFFLNGRLVEDGTTEEMSVSPMDPETENYICGRFG